jgi:hypothetical protein
MTVFQKVVSVTFATIVLIISVVLMLTLGGVLEPTFGANIMENIVNGEFWSKVLFAIAVVLLVLAIKEIAFGEKVATEGKDGIILENETGKLIISKESLENLISGVGKEIEGVESISSRTYIDLEKNVIVNANVVVGREVIIKELSTELQKKIKSALKHTADLDVKFVNIKIKNISNKKTKKSTDKVASETQEKVLDENIKEG